MPVSRQLPEEADPGVRTRRPVVGGTQGFTSRRRRLAVSLTAGPLLTRLFSEPFVEHWSREADVPPDPMTRQAACPHGLVDPARPDVEIPSGLIRAKQPVLLERSL
jgi:hypothetical protein